MFSESPGSAHSLPDFAMDCARDWARQQIIHGRVGVEKPIIIL